MGLSLDLTPHEMRQRISSSGKPFSALTASLKIATELGSGWKREKLFLHICLNLQVSDVRQSLCAAVPDRPMLTTRRNAKCISRRQRDSSAKPPARGDAEQGTARWYLSHPHAAWLRREKVWCRSTCCAGTRPCQPVTVKCVHTGMAQGFLSSDDISSAWPQNVPRRLTTLPGDPNRSP